MPEESTATLQAEVDRLRRELAAATAERDHAKSDNETIFAEVKELRGEARAYRLQLREIQEQLKAKEGELADISEGFRDLDAEKEELEKQLAAAPDEWRMQYEDLRGKLRERDHRDAFSEAAKARGIRDESKIKALYTLSGYTPESDDVDAGKLDAVIRETLKGYSWFADQAPAAEANGTGPGAVPGPSPAATPTTPRSAAEAAQHAPEGAHASGTAPAAPERPNAAPNGQPGPGADRGQSLGSETPIAKSRTKPIGAF